MEYLIGSLIVLATSIFVILIFRWRNSSLERLKQSRKEKIPRRNRPRYRGTFYSDRHGCLVDDYRSDAEMEEDANKARE